MGKTYMSQSKIIQRKVSDYASVVNRLVGKKTASVTPTPDKDLVEIDATTDPRDRFHKYRDDFKTNFNIILFGKLQEFQKKLPETTEVKFNQNRWQLILTPKRDANGPGNSVLMIAKYHPVIKITATDSTRTIPGLDITSYQADINEAVNTAFTSVCNNAINDITKDLDKPKYKAQDDGDIPNAFDKGEKIIFDAYLVPYNTLAKSNVVGKTASATSKYDALFKRNVNGALSPLCSKLDKKLASEETSNIIVNYAGVFDPKSKAFRFTNKSVSIKNASELQADVPAVRAAIAEVISDIIVDAKDETIPFSIGISASFPLFSRKMYKSAQAQDINTTIKTILDAKLNDIAAKISSTLPVGAAGILVVILKGNVVNKYGDTGVVELSERKIALNGISDPAVINPVRQEIKEATESALKEITDAHVFGEFAYSASLPVKSTKTATGSRGNVKVAQTFNQTGGKLSQVFQEIFKANMDAYAGSVKVIFDSDDAATKCDLHGNLSIVIDAKTGKQVTDPAANHAINITSAIYDGGKYSSQKLKEGFMNVLNKSIKETVAKNPPSGDDHQERINMDMDNTGFKLG